MNWKKLLAVAFYLAAIVVPTAALLLRFGLNTDIDLSGSRAATEQLLSLGGAVVAGFLIAVIAGRLMVSESESVLSLVSDVLRDCHHGSSGSVKAARR